MLPHSRPLCPFCKSSLLLPFLCKLMNRTTDIVLLFAICPTTKKIVLFTFLAPFRRCSSNLRDVLLRKWFLWSIARITSRFPCYILLTLSWNTTNENPSTDKVSRAIIHQITSPIHFFQLFLPIFSNNMNKRAQPLHLTTKHACQFI